MKFSPATVSAAGDFLTCARALSPGLRWAWWLGVGLAVLGALLEAGTAAAIWRLLARLGGIESNSVAGSMTQLAALVLGLVVVKNTLRLIELACRENAVERTVATLSHRLYCAWLRAPWRDHLVAAAGQPAHESGLLAELAGREVFFSVATALAETLAFVALALVVLAVAPPAAVLALTAGAAVLGLVLALTHRGQRHWHARRHALSADHAGFLGQSFAGVRELQTFGRLPVWEQQQQAMREGLARLTARGVIFHQWPPVLVDTLFIGGIVAAAVMLGPAHDATGGLPLVVFIAYAGFRLLPALNRIVFRLQRLHANRVPLAAVAARLRAGPMAPVARTRAPVGDPGSILVFEGVSFTYPGATDPCLRDLSFTLRPGERVAIMGSSGGGKTTLLHLALGLLSPTRGRIRLTPASAGLGLSGQAGYVGQDGWVFDHTLAGNVALTWQADEIDAARLHTVLRLAGLEDWIATLPEREHTRAGAGGLRLSGGQRQRLCVARALYAEPSCLFLDEATAALDPHTEAALLAALHALPQKPAQLWVTHRASVARTCDRVWFLSGGTIAAEGRYDELIARVSAFRAFTTSGR